MTDRPLSDPTQAERSVAKDDRSRRAAGALRSWIASPDGERQAMRWRGGLIGMVMVGTTTLVLYSTGSPRARYFETLGGGGAVSVASLLVGSFAGFLFGIPRSRQSRTREEGRRTNAPNTNLEDISDWLTKILVGLGLVQVGRAPNALSRLGQSIAPLLGDRPTSAAFGLAIALLFAVVGFLWCYLWARLDLSWQFDVVDSEGHVVEGP